MTQRRKGAVSMGCAWSIGGGLLVGSSTLIQPQQQISSLEAT
jgi:hypothetical protein